MNNVANSNANTTNLSKKDILTGFTLALVVGIVCIFSCFYLVTSVNTSINSFAEKQAAGIKKIENDFKKFQEKIVAENCKVKQIS